MSDSLQDRVQSIVDRYQPIFAQLQAEGEKMEGDFEAPGTFEAVINIDFDVSWEDTSIIFDVPSVTMKTIRFSLDIPEVTMNTKSIVFDTPSVRMVTRVVGKYPCFRGFKIYSCDMKMDIPEVFMERQDIRMDIPEFTMRRKDISFDVPEFFMQRIEWKLHLPQFTAKSVSAAVSNMEHMASELKDRGEKLSLSMKAEIDAIMVNGMAVGAQASVAERNAAAAPFNDGIAKIMAVIDQLVARKVDPIRVPVQGGEPINMRKQLDELVAGREAALVLFDAQNAPSAGAFLALHEESEDEPQMA